MKFGKVFEAMVSNALIQYQRKNQLRLKKVDPPTRVVGKGSFRKIIYLENPFLDYVGAWNERGGRAVFLEAKSTVAPRLPLGDNGITGRQVEALILWKGAGAVAFVLWFYEPDNVVMIKPDDIMRVYPTRKHCVPADGVPVPRGTGFILWDFLEVMRREFPDSAK